MVDLDENRVRQRYSVFPARHHVIREADTLRELICLEHNRMWLARSSTGRQVVKTVFNSIGVNRDILGGNDRAEGG